MDYFEVMGKDTEVLLESELVSQLQKETESMDRIPVVFREKVAYCSAIDGGELEDGTHVVELVDFSGGLSEDHFYMDFEIHTNESAYLIEVTDSSRMFDGQDKTSFYATSASYVQSPMTFADGLLEAVDGRETHFAPDNE